MTAIERAEALLERANNRCSEECICGAAPLLEPCGPHCEYPPPDRRALPCARCSFQRTAEVALHPKRDLLRGYIAAVKALGGLMEIAETAMPDSYFRSDRRTKKARRALADFEHLFPEETSASAD